MSTKTIEIIDRKIEALVNDKNKYTFLTIKNKVETILKSVDTFLIEDELDSKAVDLYLKSVISRRIKKEKEKEKTAIETTKETKYMLIEEICKNLEFEKQEELIKKIQELEKKTNFELLKIKKQQII